MTEISQGGKEEEKISVKSHRQIMSLNQQMAVSDIQIKQNKIATKMDQGIEHACIQSKQN